MSRANPLGTCKIHKEMFTTYVVDTFQDFLIADHMKPHMNILEISISLLNHVIVRPKES